MQYEYENSQTDAPFGHKIVPILLIFLSIVSLVVGVILIMFWNFFFPVTPEARLAKAVNNHLKVSYIKQDFTVRDLKAKSVINDIESESDFSDPAQPKSAIHYRNSSPELEMNGEIVALEKRQAFGKIDEFTVNGNNAIPSQLFKRSQWYKVSKNDTGTYALFNPVNYAESVNTPLGPIPVGNASKKARKNITDFMKTSKTYVIKDSESREVDGREVTILKIDWDAKKSAALNKTVVKQFGLDEKDVESPMYENPSWTLTVDNMTNQFVKSVFVAEEKGAPGKKISTEVRFSYPKKVTIREPRDALSASTIEKDIGKYGDFLILMMLLTGSR